MELRERIARAINGPWSPVPEGSKFSLEQLREARWGWLSEQERGARLCEADAVIREFEVIRGSTEMA